MIIKVYCDNGGYHKILENYKNIIVYGFAYENINRKIQNKGLPSSNMTWDDFNNSPATIGDLSFGDFYETDIFSDIVKIVGVENKIDANHLDSAYKNKCDVFLTSDCGDIYSKRDKLEPLLNIKIFMPQKNVEELKLYLDNKL